MVQIHNNFILLLDDIKIHENTDIIQSWPPHRGFSKIVTSDNSWGQPLSRIPRFLDSKI